MKAELVRHDRVVDELGNVVEIKVWRLPLATRDKPHGFKYSLAYIEGDDRVVGYDNAEGKGDHRHVRDREEPYKFVSLAKLARDFFGDIENYKRGGL